MKKKDLVDQIKGLSESGRVEFIEERSNYSADELKKMFPGKKLCVCDFYIDGFEKGEIKDYGMVYEGILNIDHHAPIKEMERYVSSGVLACNYVRKYGPLEDDYKIIIPYYFLCPISYLNYFWCIKYQHIIIYVKMEKEMGKGKRKGIPG